MSRNREKLSVSAMLILLLVCPSAVAVLAPAEDGHLVDDAYHYRFFADGRHDANYIEWWYFNLFDTEQQLQAIFTYFIADPENRSGRGLAQVATVAYTPEGIVSAVDGYSPAAFSASSERADVQIEANAIEVISDDTYRIVGGSRDGRLAWDLMYERRSGPWFAADGMKVGRLPWERMSWLIYMPGADVSGEVVVDGRVYAVAAPGYHDHNWGEWIFTNALWNWAQYFAPGLAFEMGDFINRPLGMASIEVQGERIVFTKDQYQLRHTHWAFDAVNRRRYPVETTLVAENQSYRLTLTLQAIETHPLRGDQPLPLPDAIIYEQTAYYQGELWKRNADGEWVMTVSLAGNGFKEYTARRY